MGNFTSKTNKTPEKEFDNFYDIIDYIATYYILTMDFKSLSKLSDKEYCDKLIILTSDIIKRYFNDMEITYLGQRIKNGVEVNKLNKDKVVFINKDSLDSLDISNDEQKSIRKKRVCIGIAKFYVKIAHIFAAIVMTVNPVYTYKNETGETVKTSLLNKDSIPKNVDRKLYKLNICDNRIRALKRGEVVDEITGNVTIHPKVCDLNVNKNGQIKSLDEEPGIQELMKLYLDDNYDYSNGLFKGMSETTKIKFNNDLKTFYTAFTGNDEMPQEITKFSDIKLRDYNYKKGCQGESSVFKTKYTINKNDDLFVQYANNTKKMIQTAADNQMSLLSVINELFRYVNDPYSGKKRIRVNPNLTEELLQNVVIKTRKIIVDLYVKCEQDYVNGIKLYEAIVESKILETTESQIANLKSEANKIIVETKNSIKQGQTIESSEQTVAQTAVVKPVEEIVLEKPPAPVEQPSLQTTASGEQPVPAEQPVAQVAPSVEQPVPSEKPVAQVAPSVEQPVAPVEQVAPLVEQPTAPVEQPPAKVEQPTAPSAAPVEKPVAPVQ